MGKGGFESLGLLSEGFVRLGSKALAVHCLGFVFPGSGVMGAPLFLRNGLPYCAGRTSRYLKAPLGFSQSQLNVGKEQETSLAVWTASCS